MAVTRSDYSLSQLDVLEAESIHIMREVAAEFERPVLLFSGGKDSIVMLALAERAFCAGQDPVPGHARGHRAQLRRGDRVPGPPGRRGRACSWSWPRCRSPSTPAGSPRRPAAGPAGTGCRPPRCSTPSRSTGSTRCSAAPGATRRRPGPRSGCSRSATSSASGTRRTSGPSCGASTTPGSGRGEHIRVFPLSNWTELDVWHYIAREKLEIPSIYFAHQRQVFERDGILLADSPFVTAGRRRAGVRDHGPLPHGRRHDVHRSGRVDRRPRWPR